MAARAGQRFNLLRPGEAAYHRQQIRDLVTTAMELWEAMGAEPYADRCRVKLSALA